MPQSQHDQLQTSVDDERITVLLNLQRTLGLRFKESILLDAQKALRQAQREDRITVFSGTKGGKRRHVPVSAEALVALETAAILQDGPSMVPANLRYIDFRDRCYRQAQKQQFQFHGQRHHYAQQRYRALTGVPAPINTAIDSSMWHGYMASQLNIDLAAAEKLDNRRPQHPLAGTRPRASGGGACLYWLNRSRLWPTTMSARAPKPIAACRSAA